MLLTLWSLYSRQLSNLFECLLGLALGCRRAPLEWSGHLAMRWSSVYKLADSACVVL